MTTTTLGRACARRGPAFAAAFGLAALAFGASARRARAQCVTVGCTQVSTARVTVNPVFAYRLSTPALTQTSLTGNLCSPGACYTGSVTTRGNRGWQLQVKLATTPNSFTVAFVQATVPPGAQAVNSGTQTWLTTTAWTTIAQANTATASAPVNVMFNARRTGGGNGQVPTAAQLAAVLQYQVVAYP